MTRLKFSTCPWCDKKLQLASAVVEKGTIKPGDKEPVAGDGDASVCIGCGMMSIFEEKAPGGLRFPTHEEWIDLQGEKVMVALLTTFAKVERNNQETMRTILRRPDWMSRGGFT